MPDTVVITFSVRDPERAVITEGLGQVAKAVYLTDLDPQARADALSGARAVLARHTARDLHPGEAGLIRDARLVQFMSAGLDFIPMHEIPAGVPIAGNGGAYSEAMAEHGVGMILAAAKKLIVQHQALGRNEFNQMATNRTLAGATCGIIGFGGIGEACARLLRAFGMRIHAINRRGAAAEPTDWIGRMDQVNDLLAASDVVILSMPLTPATKGMIGPRELGIMKPDAILLNLARGEVIQEAALFDHLRANPDFFACIDAWWVEPIRQGEFRMDYPFMTLPNVVGSPHNSASVPGMTANALRRALTNIKRALAGEAPHYLLAEHERMI